MAGRQVYNPDGFRNIEENGKVTGFQFEIKAQYYRGMTLSIVRKLEVEVDGEAFPKESLRFTVNHETFTMEEMRTVIDSDYRWEFGEFAAVSVMKEGGLAPGKHHIKTHQVIAPSYMPFALEHTDETDFEM